MKKFLGDSSKVFKIRGTKVMLDRDVARTLGVETFHLNENAKQSPKWDLVRGDERYRFQLNRQEIDFLRSKNSIFKENQILTYLPWVYTRLGCYHFGTSLTSPEANQLAMQMTAAVEAEIVKRTRSRSRKFPPGVSDQFKEGVRIYKSCLKFAELLGNPREVAETVAEQAVLKYYSEIDMALLKDYVSGGQPKLLDSR